MEKLHESRIQTKYIAPKEGQRALSCSNKASSRCPSLGFKEKSRTLLTIERYRKLTGDVLSSEDKVIQRLQFLDSLCRNFIKDEIQKYEQSQKIV